MNRVGLITAQGFFTDIIVGVGFVSGIFTRVGVDPETEIIKAFAHVLDAISPGTGTFLIVLGVLMGIMTWVGVYFVGGWLGVGATVLGFIAGLLLNGFGMFLLLVAWVIGLFAVSD